MAFSLEQLFEHFPAASKTIELFWRIFCYLGGWQGQCSWSVGREFAWRGSRFLPVCKRAGVHTDPNNDNRGWCVLSDNVCGFLLSVCYMHKCLRWMLHTYVKCPGVRISCWHLNLKTMFQQSSIASIWYSLCATCGPALIPYYLCFQSLAFILSVSVFVLHENQS